MHNYSRHSVEDARSEFKQKIAGYLEKLAAKAKSHDRKSRDALKSHDNKKPAPSHHRAHNPQPHNPQPHWNR
jgi:hypothetical protein